MENDEVIFSSIIDSKTPERDARARIAAFCSINLADLETALARHSALFSYAVAVHESAKVDEARSKWEKEKAEAKAYSDLLREDPKVAIGAAQLRIKTMPVYEKAVGEHLETQVVLGRLKALVNGLEHRRDMLVQLASRQRAEMMS